jgi:hypothetical protein
LSSQSFLTEVGSADPVGSDRWTRAEGGEQRRKSVRVVLHASSSSDGRSSAGSSGEFDEQEGWEEGKDWEDWQNWDDREDWVDRVDREELLALHRLELWHKCHS